MRAGWARTALISLAGAATLLGVGVLAYQLALARVPQHRAVLERLVRAQTGLDVRFSELGLRWGWYGPEAVFRGVELGEPGRSNVLLRAPELTVGFDAWRSMRSGQLEAGRISLVAPDIDFERIQTGNASARDASARGGPSGLQRVKLLQRWRDGQIEIQGGTVRLPDPSGAHNPLMIQVRRASVRRSGEEWNLFALVYLPERLGRTASVALRLRADPRKPDDLSGSLRLDARRLVFAGWHEFRELGPEFGRFSPASGGGDVTLNVDFDRGRIVKADGDVHAAGVVMDPQSADAAPLNLDRLVGKWRASRRGPDWRLRVDSLEMGSPSGDFASSARAASSVLTLDAGPAAEWVRGKLTGAGLRPAAHIARWLAPQLTLEDTEIDGTVRDVDFDWDGRRAPGHRLVATAALSGISVTPASHVFGINANTARISATENELTADVRDAAFSGGDTWPAVSGMEASLSWRGTRVRAVAKSGSAGAFALESATAEWDVAGPAHVNAVLRGRLQDAVDFLRTHPGIGGHAAELQNFALQGATRLDIDVSLVSPIDSTPDTRVAATFADAQFQLVAGAAPIQALSGSLVFEAERLQRTTLTGQWLGGPVTLRVGERHEHGKSVLSAQARGVLDASQLAILAGIDPRGRLTGATDWTADLTYFPQSDSQAAQWRVRADSGLLGVVSQLPEPLAKAAGVEAPLRVDLSGTDSGAQLRISLGDRVRSLLSLQRTGSTGWRVERGAVNLGATATELPAEPVVLLQGQVDRLDLPAYLAAWRQTREEPESAPIRAQIFAEQMLVDGRAYSDVTLAGNRLGTDTLLTVDCADFNGVVRWPVVATESGPVDVHLAHLKVPVRTGAADLAAIAAAVGANARVTIDDLVWEGRSVGRVSTTFAAREDGVAFDDLRVSGGSHEGHGTVRCSPGLAACRMAFTLESTDARSTLEDFGFRPDVSAAKAEVAGNLQWRTDADRPWAATAEGRVSIKLADGTTHAAVGRGGTPLGMLAVPALVAAMAAAPPHSGATAEDPTPELRFARFEADFDLHDGEASTSDLHFDGDAEILMRGRTGLLARDYDQQVWILKGEERLPAPVRRMGPSPRVAAAWLTLREMFAGTTAVDRSRAVLRLQGSWDEPVVVENR